VEIKVYQGERSMSKDNRLLGVFQLVGIPSAPRGIPQIEVTFDIDANGILHVSAKDRGTGNEQKITITSSSGLSKDEVEKLARDADAHKAEDERHKEEIEARNQLDSMVYSSEKMLKEHHDKVSEAEAKDVQDALADAKKAMGAGGIDGMKSAQEKLTKASHKLAEAMYRAAGTQAGAPPDDGAAAGAPKDAGAAKDNVVDAEFVDVDDKKK
jgi:molecular chaperone DnaK